MKHIFLTIFAFLIFCLPVTAQDGLGTQTFVPPGSNYQNNAGQIYKQLKQQSLSKTDKIGVDNIEVSLVHHHYMEPGQFGIMLKLPNSSAGCYELSPLEYNASFIDNNYMDIKVENYRRKLLKTENPSFGCDQKSKAVTGLVVISAKDLQKRNIRQIRFNNGKAIDYYNIVYKKDSITLMPESMIAFKAKGLSGPDKNRLTHYFSGQGLVALHVPMARENENLAQSVRTLAYKHSLQPVFEQEGLDTSGKNNVFYFMDSQGTTLDQLNDDGYVELGTIQALRPYDGVQGRQGLTVPLKVFATRPGTTL